MNSIAIDLATATNVMVVVVNIVLVVLNTMLLNQLHQFRLSVMSSGQFATPGGKKTIAAPGDSKLLSVISASDHAMAERERLRRDAEHMERLADEAIGDF